MSIYTESFCFVKNLDVNQSTTAPVLKVTVDDAPPPNDNMKAPASWFLENSNDYARGMIL